MHQSLHALSKGLTFTRAAVATALAPATDAEKHRFAAARWGSESRVADFLRKSAVGGTNATNTPELTDPAVVEFIEVVQPLTILGKLRGLRRVPPNSPFVAQIGVATAYWTAQGKATPVSKSAFDRTTMASLKIAALCVFDKALLESADPRAENLIRHDLTQAVAGLSDQTFIDAGNSGISGQMPAAITYGAPTLTSSGSLAEDLAAAIEAFQGDIQSAAWVMHPRLAVQIGLLAGGRGVAADLGARGGSLAGLPAIVSPSCQLDSDGGTITLLDAASVCLLDEGAELFISKQGTVEMDSTPTGDTITPAAATKQLVSLFQTDSCGLIVSRSLNWKLARAGAVISVTGCHYSAV